MGDFATAEVRLWGERVGVLAESSVGERIFEYDPDFRRTRLEISPIMLPLRTRGPQTFPELVRSRTFEGLPGVFSDSLPDAFGTRLIDRHFADLGQIAPAPPSKTASTCTRWAGFFTPTIPFSTSSDTRTISTRSVDSAWIRPK